jgi:hypothetical protein
MSSLWIWSNKLISRNSSGTNPVIKLQLSPTNDTFPYLSVTIIKSDESLTNFLNLYSKSFSAVLLLYLSDYSQNANLYFIKISEFIIKR